MAADLDLIARVFGLNTAQIAEICGPVTRPTVYAWRDGAAPRPAKLARIHMLRRAALDWERSGFGVPGTAMTAPVIYEKSLFDLRAAVLLWSARWRPGAPLPTLFAEGR